MFIFNCLMVAGGTLTEEMRDALYRTACKMVYEDQPKMSVREDTFTVKVYTDFKRSGLGCFTGFIFQAYVEGEELPRRISTKFLVDPADLENFEKEEGFWISIREQVVQAEKAWLN